MTKIPERRLALITGSIAMLGPFSIDAYLPAFPEMGAALGATPLQVQQTLTAYLAAFAVMNLWHGSLSDALGRRTVLLWAQAIFALASLGAASVDTIGELWFWRAVQGTVGGAGFAIGRAVVRDQVGGSAAQRLLSQSMMVFTIAPVIAPMLGGLMLALAGWRSVFLMLAVIGAALWLMTWKLLPETLAPDRRQSLHPIDLARAYFSFFTSASFWRISGALSTTFVAFFLYILAAPAFLIEHLGAAPTEFYWVFVPAMLGTLTGSFASSRLAGKWSLEDTIRVGYLVMGAAALGNVALNAIFAARIPWAVAHLAVFNFGLALAMSALQVRLVDLAPLRRGMVSSCQAFVQSIAGTLTAGLLVPLLWHSTLRLAFGMLGLLAIGALLAAIDRRFRRLAAAAR